MKRNFSVLATAELARRVETQIVSQGLALPAHAEHKTSKNAEIETWRRRWDSNPRGRLNPTSLAVKRFRPLSHVSVLWFVHILCTFAPYHI